MATRLVLASTSPRRQALLRYLVDDFDTEAIPVEEVAPRSLSVGDAVEVIARKKALAVSAKRPNDYVLAGDTVVVLGNELINKAYDEQTERRQLTMLMGGTHQVWTGLALAWGGKALDHRQAVTAVQMERLPIAVLDAYIGSNQWQGKAGGYGVQDRMLAPFLRVMAGPWSNVVGLPLAKTADLLKSNGIACKTPPDESWLRDHNPF